MRREYRALLAGKREAAKARRAVVVDAHEGYDSENMKEVQPASPAAAAHRPGAMNWPRFCNCELHEAA